jgi:hypothetical protein
MKKSTCRILTFLCVLLTAPPAELLAKMKIQIVQMKGVDCSTFKTYQWLPTKALGSSGVVENDPRLTALIKDAVNSQMTAKGLKEVAEGGDLQVATVVLKESSPQLEAIIYGWFPAADYVGFVGGPMGTVGRYNSEGTFVVNLIITKTQKSAWAAIAKDSLGKQSSNEKKFATAAEKMFKDYPPKPKSK